MSAAVWTGGTQSRYLHIASRAGIWWSSNDLDEPEAWRWAVKKRQVGRCWLLAPSRSLPLHYLTGVACPAAPPLTVAHLFALHNNPATCKHYPLSTFPVLALLLAPQRSFWAVRSAGLFYRWFWRTWSTTSIFQGKKVSDKRWAAPWGVIRHISRAGGRRGEGHLWLSVRLIIVKVGSSHTPGRKSRAMSSTHGIYLAASLPIHNYYLLLLLVSLIGMECLPIGYRAWVGIWLWLW